MKLSKGIYFQIVWIFIGLFIQIFLMPNFYGFLINISGIVITWKYSNFILKKKIEKLKKSNKKEVKK